MPAPAATHLAPTREAGRRFVARGIDWPVVMLNLLRFPAVADYSAAPDLAPAEPIDSAEAYELYIRHTLPFTRVSGGDLIFLGIGGPFLIRPDDEDRDLAMLVRQIRKAPFLAFAGRAGYHAGLDHRTAALRDSRLLPLIERSLPA